MSYGWVHPHWTGDYALDEIELGVRVSCHLSIIQAAFACRPEKLSQRLTTLLRLNGGGT